MIERAERSADVVEQRHHDIFLVAAIPVGTRRGLQAMFNPIDRKTAIIGAEELQLIENPLAISRREFLLLAAVVVPILIRTLEQRMVCGGIVRHSVLCILSLSNK